MCVSGVRLWDWVLVLLGVVVLNSHHIFHNDLIQIVNIEKIVHRENSKPFGLTVDDLVGVKCCKYQYIMHDVDNII